MKGQGLPVSTLIIILLAILILVLVVVFIILPISKTSNSIKPPASNVSSFEFTCSTDCSLASSPNPASTSFCTATLPGYPSVHCYSQIPGTSSYVYGSGSCVYTDSFGKTITADSSDC
ncbi:MAG: hypothetical protein M1580_01175 [Candidatus Parvarchaeota archaeon]|nr:hypothetical protein [Candidatus Parvarchaeota archaeon]